MIGLKKLDNIKTMHGELKHTIDNLLIFFFYLNENCSIGGESFKMKSAFFILSSILKHINYFFGEIPNNNYNILNFQYYSFFITIN